MKYGSQATSRWGCQWIQVNFITYSSSNNPSQWVPGPLIKPIQKIVKAM